MVAVFIVKFVLKCLKLYNTRVSVHLTAAQKLERAKLYIVWSVLTCGVERAAAGV